METPYSNFLLTLSSMLNKYHSSITFRRDNDTIVISDLRSFIGQILPRYFRHRNFKLFCQQVFGLLSQLNSHGLTVFNTAFRVCASRNGTWVKSSSGVERLKMCMRYVRQLGLVGRMGGKLRKAIDGLGEGLGTDRVEELVEKLFQMKRLNRDYEQCIEACSRRIQIKVNQMMRNVGAVGKMGNQQSQWILEEATQQFISQPLQVCTERVIRFAN